MSKIKGPESNLAFLAVADNGVLFLPPLSPRNTPKM
jgi:hypothetical protein